jgi:hypothetical protein
MSSYQWPFDVFRISHTISELFAAKRFDRYRNAPYSGENIFIFEKPDLGFLLMVCWRILPKSYRFWVIRVIRFGNYRGAPSGENIFVQKPDPNLLLAFCWNFTSISNTSISNQFRVIQDYSLAIDTSHYDRKWRHQSICRPRCTTSVQYMFWVYCIPFTSYRRREVNKYRLSISAARGRREPEVKSPLDSSTTVSY